MSNPLASAEARQAAERILSEEGLIQKKGTFKLCAMCGSPQVLMPEMKTRLTAIIADSYADLVAERDALKDELADLTDVSTSLANTVGNVATQRQAAESRNRELVEKLLEIAELGDCQNIDCVCSCSHVKELAEAAIQSATPKQGEGNENV